MRVLVCDDEAVVLKVVEVALGNKATELIFVKDGDQAMKALKDNSYFDLIITDIHMPYYNGDDILRFVREEQGRNTPVVMLSSDGEEEVIALALKQGVNDFIVKPVTAEKLLKKIDRFLLV
jgi:CheY-like chemotaxis protein